MTTTHTSTSTSIHWLSDLHLNKTTTVRAARLLKSIAATESGCLAISGDISSARHLSQHLRQIAQACHPKPVFFVPGNHDYYGGSIDSVNAEITRNCRQHKNLNYLDGRQIIPLSRTTCLVGHRGWADGRAGYGKPAYLKNPDLWAIEDFRGLKHRQALAKMKELGADSARLIRRLLPLALTRFPHVILLTHVPPFREAVLYDGKPCEGSRLPHYVNLSAGMAIRGIARSFPKRKITVLAGHTHSSFFSSIAPNICIRVAHSRTGRPDISQVLQFD